MYYNEETRKQAKQKKDKYFERKKRHTKHEVYAMVQKQVKKVFKQKEQICNEKQHAFKKMSVSDSYQESISNTSSEDEKV